MIKVTFTLNGNENIEYCGKFADLEDFKASLIIAYGYAGKFYNIVKIENNMCEFAHITALTSI